MPLHKQHKPGVRYHYGSSFRVKASKLKRSALKKSQKPMKRREGPIKQKCKVCGKVYGTWPFRIKAGVRACSTKCAGVLKRNRSVHKCVFCGGEFQRAISQVFHRGAKYCSRPCYEAAKVAEAADRPTRDRWGRTSRHADKVWQGAVRERDNYTCQRCGKYDRYINTHHVAPRSQRPDLKHDVSNGKCLCNGCHQWVHMHPKEAQALGLLNVSETYEVARASGRRADNALLTYKGETTWMAEWARRLGCDRHVLEARRKRGWSDGKIIETPIRHCEGTTLTYQGRTMNLTDWSRETGLHLATIRARVRAGWSPDRILETAPIPPRLRRSRGA